MKHDPAYLKLARYQWLALAGVVLAYIILEWNFDIQDLVGAGFFPTVGILAIDRYSRYRKIKKQNGLQMIGDKSLLD